MTLLGIQLQSLLTCSRPATCGASYPIRRNEGSMAIENARMKRDQIVDYLREEGEKTAAEIAQEFGMNKTTAHTDLHILMAEGRAAFRNHTSRRCRVFYATEDDE